MHKTLGSKIRKIALAVDEDNLTKEDLALLRSKPMQLIKDINERVAKGKDPLKEMSDRDKRILLSFVVFQRQNLALTPGGHPNEEDAAKVLHGIVYEITGNKKEDKETIKELEEDLKDQLQKIGISLEKKE